MAHHELLLGDVYRSARGAHYRSVAVFSGMVLLAGYLALRADHFFLMCLFIAIGGWQLVRSVSFPRSYWATPENCLFACPETQIKLEVREDGLHETTEGIETFAPWSSVKTFAVFRDILFIGFATGQWAIIPRGSVSPSPGVLDGLIRILTEKGVSELLNLQETPTKASDAGDGKTGGSRVNGTRR